MIVSLISAVVGALPEGFVLLLGLGAAAWLYGRYRPAGIALGIGIVLLALGLLLHVVTWPLLSGALEQGWVPGEALPLAHALVRLLLSVVSGLGIVGLLAGACLGTPPAPDFTEEVS